MSKESTSSIESGLFLPGFKRTESTFEEIPVIDIEAAYGKDPVARRLLADLIRDACINVGFFYIKSHDIPEEVIDSTIDAAKEYFALPEGIKMELDIHKTPNFKGYTALLGENTDVTGLGDLHEGFDLGWEPFQLGSKGILSDLTRDDGAMSGGNVWPHGLPKFRDRVLDYYHRVLRVGQLLFPIFALALDLPANFFDDKTTKPAAIMRLLHYPPQNPTSLETDPQGKQIGIGAHTERVSSSLGRKSKLIFDPHLLDYPFPSYECFTILWQDRSGGLQVQNTEAKWIDAVPIRGTLVVNLGDQFARWTNDVFKSTLHRVVNRSGAERYSIPLFFGTDYSVLLEPIPTCLTPGEEPRYPVVTAGEYVKSRLEATYTQSAK